MTKETSETGAGVPTTRDEPAKPSVSAGTRTIASLAIPKRFSSGKNLQGERSC